MGQFPRIHPDTIEAVKQGVDVVEVVSDYVVLKKRGKDYLGLCPFHPEKTPSFSVSKDKQLYYCFGCGAGGNSFKFLMEISKQSFAEVVLDLARRYQIPVETVEPEERQEIQRQLSLREQLYEVLAVTSNFFHHALHQSPGEIALNYLQQDRGLSAATIQDFQLGYAPGGWETLYRYLVEQKRYSVDLLLEAGLVKPRKEGNGYYDVFRDRVIIPIKDTQSRVIGFGSRTLNDANQPKYLNSPETTLFDKSKTLFALDQARKSIAREDKAIVVEGYFDVIALHVVGITNVVASLGTAFTDSQLKKLLRHVPSKQVVLNFDADAAGVKATERAIAEIKDLIYSGQVQLRVLNLPGGKDADEFLKTSPEAIANYQQAVDDAPLWLDWQINNLVTGKNLKAADQMQEVATGMVKLLNRLQDSNQRNYYLARCAEILSQEEARLRQYNFANLKSQLAPEFRRKKNLYVNQKRIATINQNKTNKTKFSVATSPEEELLTQAESLLLRIYVHCPRHRSNIIERLEAKDLCFSLPRHRFLWQEIMTIEQEISQNRSANSNYANENPVLEQLHHRSVDFDSEMSILSELLSLNEKTQEDLFRADKRIATAIASLEQVTCIKYQLYCTEQLEKINPLVDGQKIQHLYEEIQDSKKKIQDLEKIRLALN